MRRHTEGSVILDGNLDRLPSSSALWPPWAGPQRGSREVELRRAITSSLTDKQREVIEAFFFEGRSQGEIARALGVSQQVVQKRLFGTMRNNKLVGGAIARLRTALGAR